MSVVSADDFLAKGFHRFATIDPANIQIWLDTATLSYVPASFWGVHRITGIMLCAAHFLEMEWFQTAETAGSATAIAAGNGGRSPSAQQDDFQLTTWGRRFTFLRKGLLDGTISPLADKSFNGTPKFGIGFPL
ncbi:DUF4054 domain-containing protein [Nostoc linckia]|uniref:DUF4054 domain-containing protein n=1 Tax=Nostoc linckia TaxID=92942 RepID=UPI000BFF92B6|nr:DUF4054 domain-containing protein [Nostoc linckia]